MSEIQRFRDLEQHKAIGTMGIADTTTNMHGTHMYHLYMSSVCQRFRDLEIYSTVIHVSFVYEQRMSEILRFRDLWHRNTCVFYISVMIRTLAVI